MRVSQAPSSAAVLAAALALLMAATAPPAASQTLPAETHPSLLFTAEELPVLRDRIGREPYAAWWRTVLERAGSVPSNIPEERRKVRYAKSAAFAWQITGDESYARQAVDLLLDVRFPPRGGDMGEAHAEGEVAAQYAIACDMIHEYAANTPADLEEIRAILAEEAQRIFDGIIVREVNLGLVTLKIRLHDTPDPRNPLRQIRNNWHVRAYAGLGLAAMALSDHPGGANTPQEWADHAYDLVTRSLWQQIDDEDGSWAEGPFYSRYAADVYLPWMYALRNLTGVDLFADPQVEATHRWSLNLRLPSGRRPNIDDAHLDDAYGHYLSAVYADGGLHRWDWEQNENGPFTRGFNEMDAIAIYDDSVEARAPDHGPTVFMPAAGDAVFRSDWGPGATYLLLRGEHGSARLHGFSHEHPDETSFLLYAGGEMLALDAGYINYENHLKVNQGHNHNLILVDGEGPPLRVVEGESIDGGNDAYLRQTFTSGLVEYAEVKAGYADTDFLRCVMFVDGSYFVVVDEVRGDGSHTYEWRLHGHGGGDSGGTYQRDGALARWTRPRAELLAFVAAPEGAAFSEAEAIHSFDYRQESTHTVMRVEAEGRDVEFLSLLYPRASEAAEPVLSQVETDHGRVVRTELGDLVDLAWTRGGDAGVRFPAPAGEVAGDGRLGLVRCEGAELTGFSFQDGTRLEAGGGTVFTASEPVDASLRLAPERVSGFLRGSDSGYTVALPMAGSPEGVTFSGTLTGQTVEADVLTLELAGEGILEMSGGTNVLEDHAAAAPGGFRLGPSYPNPFNAGTVIPFALAEPGWARVTVFNSLGRKVRTLVDGELPAGAHRAAWDGRDEGGEPAASGVYLARLRSGAGTATRRLLLLR